MRESKPYPGRSYHKLAVFEFIVSILLCWQVRDYLEGLQFEGKHIEWREGRGWLERSFIVKGRPEDVAEVKTLITLWGRAKT